MGGLNISISSGIRILKPKTLTEVINLARLRDEQLQQEKRWSGRWASNTRSSPPLGQPHFDSARTVPITDKQAPTPRRLSWEELKKKRSLGLCFSCDEKFTMGQKCKQPQFFIMEGENEPEYDDEEERVEDDQSPEITLHALSGWDAPTTSGCRKSLGYWGRKSLG